MPRLGTSTNNDSPKNGHAHGNGGSSNNTNGPSQQQQPPLRRRTHGHRWKSIVSSFVHRFRSNSNVATIIVLLCITFVLRNLFFHDYRSEELYQLQNSGMSIDDIERYVPKTASERRKYVNDKKNDIKQMKQDIAYLLQEVNELRSQNSKPKTTTTDGRIDVDDDQINMDRIHLEKRKKREENDLGRPSNVVKTNLRTKRKNQEEE